MIRTQMRVFLLAYAGLIATIVLAGCATLPPAPDIAIDSSPELVSRGKYLVEGIGACAACHTPTQDGRPVPGMHLAGATRFEQGLGWIRMANITPDPETGIGSWTDGEIFRAIREGIDRDGKIISFMMPSLAYRDIAVYWFSGKWTADHLEIESGAVPTTRC